MKLFSSFLIFVFITLFSHFSVFADEYNFVVAADGSGDFQTVQDAIDAVPDFRKKETVIFIKNGVYKEKLVLPASKNQVTFMGEDVEKTIITNDDYASKKNVFGEEMGTTGSSGFFVFGNDFTARNITFENSAGPVGQAVAVRVDGDRVFFNNCRFLGFQDTLYPHGKNSLQYYKNCYIEGTVDFIFGWSTAVFDECEIFCKRHGYITAASTDKDTPFGFVFFNCKIHGDADENSVYLGRPWRPYAKTVFIGCELSGVINPGGWHNWGKESNEETAFYAEYQNYGPGADTQNRVEWSHQLNDKEAASYNVENILNFSNWINK
jgi:pectinesterase